MNNTIGQLVTDQSVLWLDVSHYQESIDMSNKFARKYKGLIIKMSQYRKDPRYDYFVWKCKQNRKKFMVYHFWVNDLDPKYQFEMIKEFNRYNVPVFIDVEEPSFQLTISMRRNTDQLLSLIDILLSNRLVPGIYTRKNIWEQHIKKNILFSSLPLWVANYEVKYPLLPRDWDDYSIWQFTNQAKGSSFGVHSDKVDLNLVKKKFLLDYGLSHYTNSNIQHYME